MPLRTLGLEFQHISSQPQNKDDEDEFRKLDFSNSRATFLWLLASVGIFYFCFAMQILFGEQVSDNHSLRQVHGMLFLSTTLLCLVFLCIYILPSTESFLSRGRNKDLVCSFWICLLFQSELARKLIADLRRSMAHDYVSPYVNLTIEFQHGFPWTWSCTDSNPIETNLRYSTTYSHEDAGCVPRLTSPESLAIYTFMGCFLPITAAIDGQAAFSVCIIQVFSLLGAGMLCGINLNLHLQIVFLHAIITIATTYLCHSRITCARERYFREKGLKVSIEQTNGLLCTIIPRSLHTRLMAESANSIIGNTMEHCTIMFLSLSPEVTKGTISNLKIFNFIDKVFSDFDAIVESFGMFKYHHIKDSYVIACPRSANPFDAPLQHEEYVLVSTRKMIQLADCLIQRARLYFSASGHVLWAKAGISAGPVAGAVVGHQRRFYCLFGDTVNTSARMCSHSEPSKILCTQSVIDVLKRGNFPEISLIEKPNVDVKGKGLMTCYFVHVDSGGDCFPSIMLPPWPRNGEKENKCFDQFKNNVSSTSSNVELSCSKKCSSENNLLSSIDDENPVWRAFLNSDSSRQLTFKKQVIHPFWCSFLDKNTEEEFLQFRAPRNFRRAILGLLCCSVASVVIFEYLLDLKIFTAEAFQHRKQVVSNLRLAVAGMSFVCLFGSLASYSVSLRLKPISLFLPKGTLQGLGRKVEFWRSALLLCQSSFYCSLLYCLSFVNCTGISLIFVPSFSYFNLLLCGTSVQRHTVFVICTLVITFALVRVMFAHISSGFAFFLLVAGYFSNQLLRDGNYGVRLQWKMSRVIQEEYKSIIKILNDLFPEDIAHEIVSTGKISYRSRRAVVLHLDLCSYTEMVSKMEPMDVARLIHKLFSKFDLCVGRAHRVFKIDTIGDAYVCAGWVTDTTERVVCKSMVRLAKQLLQTVKAQSEEWNIGLRCRIGVALGTCGAGAVGKLQPRYHIIGQAMENAKKLEGSAMEQSIHVGDSVRAAISGFGEFNFDFEI